MKINFCSLVLTAILLGGGLPAEAQNAPAPAAVAMPEASAWKTPDKLKQQLATEITKRLQGVESKQIQAFLKNEENKRLLLMFYIAYAEAERQEEYRNYNNSLNQQVQGKKDEIARLEKEVSDKTGPEKKNAEYRLSNARKDLKALQQEVKYPIDLSKNAKVLKAILSDTQWMEQILFSGEMIRFGRIVTIISAIAESDNGALKKGVARDTTTALALEYARCGSRTVKAVERAGYFLKYWRQGRLNSTFDKLPMHHRRVVCGWKPDHRAGTITAFEWALDNVHVPDWQYPASCWRCGYILDNVYGDSIHGPYYFAPWEGVWTDNHMALTQYVGGVCGGLSHFGAASACANGVPALTMGEPGHCAYAVLVDGKWTPAYSLSWERGLHWLPWENNYTYSSLHLTDALYSKDNAAKTRLSNACRMLAKVYTDKGDAEKARTCYELAAKAAPLNYPMWREYSAFLSQHMPKNAEAWKKLNSVLCSGMASAYPEQAAELFRRGILNCIAACGMSAEDMAEACALFWKHAETMGPDRWYVEQFADAQLQACKNVGGDTETVVISLQEKVLGAAVSHDAYSGIMIARGNNLSERMSAEGKEKMTAAMARAIGSNKKMDAGKRAGLLGGLIVNAERSRDTTTFYAISKMIDPKEIHGNDKIPDFDPFPGKLVSEGGLPFASSTSQWDAPHTHSGVLSKQGGKIHTNNDTNAWVAVKLPKHAYITGVVFAGLTEPKLKHRFHPIRVQVSDTGRDDDWHDVGPLIENSNDYIHRFDLQQERPKALYVRILRPGGPEFFNATGIYVYGDPAA